MNGKWGSNQSKVVVQRTDIKIQSFPARVHVILARDSSQAIVIRRGPSNQVAVIGWDRDNDKFLLGQWLRGRIHHYRCDLSPNGKYFIYFARGRLGKTWTVVSKTPYLRALDFYSKNDSWLGGGLFLTDKEYWLNDISYKKRFQRSKLLMTQECPSNEGYGSECPSVYFIRLVRDGWNKVSNLWLKERPNVSYFLFEKKLDNCWRLYNQFYADLHHPMGKSVYYEKYQLINGDKVIDCPDWEWADIDGNRIVWAEKGKLMAGKLDKSGLHSIKELYDFNSMQFEERIAPY